MSLPIQIKSTVHLLVGDAVCVLYAMLGDVGPISGIFETYYPELGIHQREDGSYSVHVWCVEDKKDEPDDFLILNVPQHGFIHLPQYDGDVIAEITIA